MKSKTLNALLVASMVMLGSSVVSADEDIMIYLPMDNVSGEDISGNQNDAILHCPFSSTTDRHGNPDGALFFDGDDDYLEVPVSATFSPQGDITISMWIKKEAEQNPNSYESDAFLLTLDEVNGVSSPIYMRMSSDSAPKPYLRLNNSYAFGVPTGEWAHIAVTFEGTNFKMYINGDLAKEGATGRNVYSETPMYIGSLRGIDYDYHGAMDDFMIFSRTFSPEEVKALATDPEPEPEVVEVEECVPLSEIPACPVYEECEVTVCPDEKNCEEPTEILEGATKKVKLHFNERKNVTTLQLHQNISGIPEGLTEGPVQIRVQMLQGGDVVEFVTDAVLSEHGVNLMDVNSANKAKERKAKKAKKSKSNGKSCKYKK